MVLLMPPKKRKKPRLDRSIYFYRIDAGKAGGKPLPLDLAPYIESVGKLDFNDGSKRYWDQPSGDPIALWTDETGAADRFALATIRRSALPRREHKGKLSSLPLEPGAGLHEPIHVRLFDQNIVGVEFNFYGPRASRLPQYLTHALGQAAPSFSLDPLIRQDVVDQLDKQKDLRLVELQIRAAYASQLSKAKHGKLSPLLKEMAKVADSEVVGLVLRPEPYGHTFLGSGIVKSIKKIAEDPATRVNAVQFRTRGVNPVSGHIDELNLLDDKLVSQQSIVRLGRNSRAVDSASAYSAIGIAYEELEDELELAASVSFNG